MTKARAVLAAACIAAVATIFMNPPLLASQFEVSSSPQTCTSIARIDLTWCNQRCGSGPIESVFCPLACEASYLRAVSQCD
jgi:hypothetical protein